MKNDLNELLDRLEDLVVHARRVPLSELVMVEEHTFIDLIDRLRLSLDDEMKDVRKLTSERDRVIGHAQSEADKILRTAEEQAARMLAETDVVQVAHARARAIIDDAEQRASELRRSSEAYVIEALSGLDDELSRLLAQIRRGRAMAEKPRERQESDDQSDSSGAT